MKNMKTFTLSFSLFLSFLLTVCPWSAKSQESDSEELPEKNHKCKQENQEHNNVGALKYTSIDGIKEMLKLGEENFERLGNLCGFIGLEKARNRFLESLARGGKNYKLMVGLDHQNQVQAIVFYIKVISGKENEDTKGQSVFEIPSVCVADSYQGTGKGKEIMQKVFEKHTKWRKGSTRFDLDATSNAVGFYQNLGFECDVPKIRSYSATTPCTKTVASKFNF